MPGRAEDDLLGGVRGVGDELVVSGDDVVDVDEVVGLCGESCSFMHRSSVSPATGSVLGIPGIGRTVSPWWPTTAQWKSWAARMRRPRPRDSPLV